MSCLATDRLLQTLRVHVPGATDDLLNLELFNVVDEFFRRTSAWRFEVEIALEEGTSEYGLAVPADTTIVRVMGASHNGHPLQQTSVSGGVGYVQLSLGTLEPERTFSDGDADFPPAATDLTGGVFSYAIYRPEYIALTTLPDAEARKYPLNAVMALSVDKACVEENCGDWAIEEWMWDMFFHDWTDGVLGRCYAMPLKPWNNTTGATYHLKRFRNAMAMRKQEALRGYTYAVPGFRFPRWTR